MRLNSWNRSLGTLLLVGASALALSCTPRPRVITPADGSYVAVPVGGVPVEIALGGGFGEGSTFRVTLLTGVDSPPANLTDVSGAFTAAGTTATGELDPGDLAPGRNTLYVSIDADGDGTAENVASSSFSWEPDLDLAMGGVCEILDPGFCLYPFPSNHFTAEDPTTDTGRRIAFSPDALPQNNTGAGVDPTEWNRNDGFSPGQALQVIVPGVSLFTPSGDPAVPPTPAPGIPPEWDLAASLAPDAAIVIIDSATGERVPHWAEPNSRALGSGQVLIRPAVNFASGGHYLVALRGLRDGAGDVIPPSRAFQLYRDGIPTYVPEIEARREHMEGVLQALEGHGVPRHDLYLAWDFTVISKRNMSERLIHIRDDAFAKLGSDAPNFVIDNVQARSGGIRWRIDGRVEVPNYLNNAGETYVNAPGAIPPGRRLTRLYCEDEAGQPRDCEGDELPKQARTRCEDEAGVEIPCGDGDEPVDTATYWAEFRCTVPDSVIAPDGSAVPARASLYGHGLLGSQRQAGSSYVEQFSVAHDFIFCAARWIGMGEDDFLTVGSILNDFSRFPTLADRLHQSMVNFLYLGRLMTHPDGLGTHEAFQAEDGSSVIDGSELFYDGNSQGAIAGGALAAVAQDFTRAVLGVPGMNYSTLLYRSVDFDQFLILLNFNYPDSRLHPLLFGLAQMLWDRVEANGHANHVTSDPYPDTPAKKILLHVAFGDFQVSDASANVQARTIGASMHRVGYDPAAYIDQNPSGDPRPFWQVDPYWGIPTIPDSPADPLPGNPNPDYRFDGSALIVWDSGNIQSPNSNLTPEINNGNPELTLCANRGGGDPHSCPRRQPMGLLQKSEFLKTDGAVLDVCEPTTVAAPAGVLDVCLAPLFPPTP